MRPLSTQECKNVSAGFLGFLLAVGELELIHYVQIGIIGAVVIALDLYAPVVAIAAVAPGGP